MSLWNRKLLKEARLRSEYQWHHYLKEKMQTAKCSRHLFRHQIETLHKLHRKAYLVNTLHSSYQTTTTCRLVLARDFQTVVLYDSKGEFVGVRRPGSGAAIDVDGMKILINSITGSTGLEFKSDPGVPVVYAGLHRSLKLLYPEMM